MVIEKRTGLVRGVITMKQDHGNFEEIKAYTFWYRHDEPNLEAKLKDATEKLLTVYMRDWWRCGAAVIGTEWRDYD